MTATIPFTGWASFSDDEVYRYRLGRDFGRPGPVHTWIMLNPSTADAETNDPTVRRCMGYSWDWGAGRIIVVNLYALRSTDPALLKTHPDPVGPGNFDAISQAAQGAALVICAWGIHGGDWGRAAARRLYVGELGRPSVNLHHLGLTADGQPRHPLYLRRDEMPRAWRPE